MPTVRKLNQEEVQDIQSGKVSPRQETARIYDALLADFSVGEWGEVALDEGDSKLTIRNRLQAAAGRRGFVLNFKRTPAPIIRFQVALSGSEEDASS